MTSWHHDLPQSPTLDALAGVVEHNSHVLAVALTGSWAHEMATDHSDIDLLLVLDEDDQRWWRYCAAGLDVAGVTVDRLRDVPADPGRWWDRYAFGRSRVLLDRSDGAVPGMLDTWGTLTPHETTLAVDFYIDGYLTFTCRSLKAHREGHELAARLDAAESLPYALPLLFALHGRVRPTNKYLHWELSRWPLGTDGWESDHVVDVIERILRDGCPTAQRELFALFEPRVRSLGFGGVIDAFRPDVTLLRDADA